MNRENTVSSPQAWQKLLCQAFQDTKITTQPNGLCKLYHVHHFIYLSLHHSGIENRSPFSLLQLIKIRLQSKGKPEEIKQLCIDTLLHMHKPAFNLLSSNYYLVTASLIISLFTLLTPITANTFKYQKGNQSILKTMTIPWMDLESDILTLPDTTDYLLAAAPLKLTKEQKQLEKLNTAAWIMNQKSTAYSLQLLSVANETNLIKFCEQYEICNNSAFYRTQTKGKKLIKLIYGSYPNHMAAKQAKEKLIATLKNVSPWARSFKQIKDEL